MKTEADVFEGASGLVTRFGAMQTMPVERRLPTQCHSFFITCWKRAGHSCTAPVLYPTDRSALAQTHDGATGIALQERGHDSQRVDTRHHWLQSGSGGDERGG